ncbi:MAG: Unknown protein [uncultured Aureispira sp.]|uniref:Outer membrane protein beta-barrel domain-containing protein n=1 Tax=uncultured Aureispira sp. TaxID=1331704 RepID=A0A6S6U4E6_9BACT|nr:MAG: Unknown protein [uncultured Aureispira sp.]
MKNSLLILTLLICATSFVLGQDAPKLNNDARFKFSPMLFIDYSFYHWYQNPKKRIDGLPQNMGQTFNVLPGLGVGAILGKKTTLLFSLEASVKYFPFSLDVAGYEGMGAVSFPVLANFRIPLNGFFFMQVGGGVQWNKINIHNRTATQKSIQNPFFMTYVGELAIGIEEGVYILYFARFGYNTDQATTFDIGFRVGLHSPLWD